LRQVVENQRFRLILFFKKNKHHQMTNNPQSSTLNPTKVSVLIITYNHEAYIQQTLDSVLSQKTDFPFEIVIGDDASTDATVELLEDYERRFPNIVKVLTTAQNLGVVPNYLRTLAACQGDFIAHLDGDDYWIDDEKLQKQVNTMEKDPQVTICYTARKVFREDWATSDFQITDPSVLADIQSRQTDEKGFYFIKDGDSDTTYSAADFANDVFFHLSTILFRRPSSAVVQKLATFKNIVDRPLSIILLEEMGGYAVQIPDVCTVFRMNNNSTFTVAAETKRIQMTNAMYSQLNSLYPHLAKYLNKHLNVSDYFLMRSAYRQKDKKTVRSLANQILSRPTIEKNWRLKMKVALHLPALLVV
jgi:glycosyltransferase involved in cell wall biosynthesis